MRGSKPDEEGSMPSFTLLESDRVHEVSATISAGRVRIPAADIREGLGWELKPEGLCRGDVCVPVSDAASLATAAGVDLQALAEAIDRPLALDVTEGAAALGTALADRTAQLASLDAPDFSLPALDGTLHSLSEHRGKKVLLIAYASW
jgi:hypothetical protein